MKSHDAGTVIYEGANTPERVDPRLSFSSKGVIKQVLPVPYETDPMVHVTWPEGEQSLPDECRLSSLVYANKADVRALCDANFLDISCYYCYRATWLLPWVTSRFKLTSCVHEMHTRAREQAQEAKALVRAARQAVHAHGTLVQLTKGCSVKQSLQHIPGEES